MKTDQKVSVEDKIDIKTLENEKLDVNQQQKEEKKNASLDRVIELTKLMEEDTDKALNMINTINRKTEFLAINALIEASRAGDTGKGFQVVAESIDVLAQKTKEAVETMRKETITEMEKLGKVIQQQSDNIRGNRLSDLALTNIDLIDRNLFERTADVRWWATDNILANALTQNTEESYQDASYRLNTILKSYTVYYDLILCDNNGNAIATGSPEKYALQGKNCADRMWFQTAIKSSNGGEYGFQSVLKSPVINDFTMVFSCKVHEEGDVNRRPVGVLGAVLNWTGLAQRIVNETPLNDDEKQNTRICITDNDGTILADNQNRLLSEKISFKKMDELFSQKKGFSIINQQGKKQIICHGLSPGYETYSSGLHSLIIYDFA